MKCLQLILFLFLIVKVGSAQNSFAEADTLFPKTCHYWKCGKFDPDYVVTEKDLEGIQCDILYRYSSSEYALKYYEGEKLKTLFYITFFEKSAHITWEEPKNSGLYALIVNKPGEIELTPTNFSLEDHKKIVLRSCSSDCLQNTD